MDHPTSIICLFDGVVIYHRSLSLTKIQVTDTKGLISDSKVIQVQEYVRVCMHVHACVHVFVYALSHSHMHVSECTYMFALIPTSKQGVFLHTHYLAQSAQLYLGKTSD